jgi:hypothetical protein
MLAAIDMLTALEIMLLPVWAGLVMAPPGAGLGRRLATLPAAVVVTAVVLLVLAGAAAEGPVGDVLRAQVVALGFVILVGGLAAMLGRLTHPAAAQILTALLGWLIVAGIILVGPLAGLTADPLREAAVRVAAHASPLLVAERELGLDWLHQGLTYRLTPLGDSYSYLIQDAAWWKTFLAHVFVGSGLVVFSLRRSGKLRRV